MAKPQERFKRDEWVVWDTAEIHTDPLAMQELAEDITEFGAGSFRIVDVCDAWEDAAHHPQMVTVRLDERLQTDKSYSARWVMHIRY